MSTISREIEVDKGDQKIKLKKATGQSAGVVFEQPAFTGPVAQQIQRQDIKHLNLKLSHQTL